MFLMRRFSTLLMMSAIMGSFASFGNNQSGNTTGANDSADKLSVTAAGPVATAIKEEAVSYTSGGTTMNSYVVYDSARQGTRPIILVLPEWWGLTEYPRLRARMLAELGYLAMAVDMYGNGQIANNPEEAQKAVGQFYSNPQMAKQRIDAAMQKAFSLPQADTTKKAVIGYCFGGSMALNYGKMGAPVLGVVSFHGGLEGVPPQKNATAAFLICHGGSDDFVPQQQVESFKKSMDSSGLNYTFNVYEGATHAFTNPNATEKGNEFSMPIRYNPAADTASWNDMKAFFNRINLIPTNKN